MSAKVHIPSIYEAYNAKWLAPPEVARSFVPPSQFNQIIKRRNSLIVGPRGSGKTTLLKMLTSPALDKWDSNHSESLKEKIDYNGVFIATDVSWNSQVSALGESSIEEKDRSLLQMAAMTAHTQKATVEAMQSRASSLFLQKTFVKNSAQKLEANAVWGIASFWHIKPHIPSFLGLIQALRQRIQSIHEIAKMLAEIGPSYREKMLEEHQFLIQPLLLSCRNAVEHFNDIYKERERYWAYLFDELELMPASIREELYRYLRTFPGPMIFKLALSPFEDSIPAENHLDSPMKDQDYDFIPLWYARKRDAYKFCNSLWEGLLLETPLAGASPLEVLGKSLLNTDTDDWLDVGTAYTKRSSHYRYLSELSKRDPTFNDYLERHEINLDKIESVKSTNRASTLRKVFPLVVARVEHSKLTRDDSKREVKSELRSRKLSAIYTGATSIFDISEGNPRLFIGLISRMIDRLPANERRVNPQIQADEITQAISRFRALLYTIVVPYPKPERYREGILSLLNPIGMRLQAKSIREDFSPEPPGKFGVDDSIDDEVVTILGYALNAGAIVHVPDHKGEERILSTKNFRAGKFRLSYLLAAHFAIPPRLGRSVTLRNLMGDESAPLFEATNGS